MAFTVRRARFWGSLNLTKICAKVFLSQLSTFPTWFLWVSFPVWYQIDCPDMCTACSMCGCVCVNCKCFVRSHSPPLPTSPVVVVDSGPISPKGDKMGDVEQLPATPTSAAYCPLSAAPTIAGQTGIRPDPLAWACPRASRAKPNEKSNKSSKLTVKKRPATPFHKVLKLQRTEWCPTHWIMMTKLGKHRMLKLLYKL